MDEIFDTTYKWQTKCMLTKAISWTGIGKVRRDGEVVFLAKLRQIVIFLSKFCTGGSTTENVVVRCGTNTPYRVLGALYCCRLVARNECLIPELFDVFPFSHIMITNHSN